jgi:methyl-accepting chemotaxis protein
MKLTIKYKIVGVALLAILLPVIVMTALTAVQKGRVDQKVGKELDILANENITQTAKDVYGLCQTANDLVQTKVNSDLKVARQVLELYGAIRQNSETIEWQAINQFTNHKEPIRLLRISIGGVWLGQNKDIAVAVPVVDDVKALVGGACTIFQRMNEQGDMLRIATNVENQDHTRAISTFIPAVNPDGTPNAVISAILRGQTYQGRAYVVNA